MLIKREQQKLVKSVGSWRGLIITEIRVVGESTRHQTCQVAMHVFHVKRSCGYVHMLSESSKSQFYLSKLKRNFCFMISTVSVKITWLASEPGKKVVPEGASSGPWALAYATLLRIEDIILRLLSRIYGPVDVVRHWLPVINGTIKIYKQTTLNRSPILQTE